MVAPPVGAPDIGQILVRGDVVVCPRTRGVTAEVQPASNPVFPVACVQNKDGIRVLGREVRKQLIGLEMMGTGFVEKVHIHEGVEIFISAQQFITVGEIPKDTPC